MTINSSILNNYNYNGYSNISSVGDTVTITTGSPSYSNHVYTVDTGSTGGYSLKSAAGIYEPEKRHHLKDEGKLPHDVWALMFNNGVLND